MIHVCVIIMDQPKGVRLDRASLADQKQKYVAVTTHLDGMRVYMYICMRVKVQFLCTSPGMFFCPLVSSTIHSQLYNIIYNIIVNVNTFGFRYADLLLCGYATMR